MDKIYSLNELPNIDALTPPEQAHLREVHGARENQDYNIGGGDSLSQEELEAKPGEFIEEEEVPEAPVAKPKAKKKAAKKPTKKPAQKESLMKKLLGKSKKK